MKLRTFDVEFRCWISGESTKLCPLGRNRSKFVDRFSQTIVQNQPSYLKDTNHAVNKIENIKDETKDSILVAMDVTFITWQKSESGIYIPCKEGINQAAPKIYRC